MPLKKRMKTSRIDLPVVVRSEVNGAAAPSRNNAPLVIIAALGLIAAMYIARDLLIPIVCAFLTALLLRPALRRMRRWRVPDIASAFVLVGVVAMVSLLGVLTLAGQAHEWLAQAPESLRKVSSMVPTNSGPLAEMVRMQEAVNDLTRTSGAPEPVQVELHSHATAFTALGISGHFIGSVLILFVLSFFLLAFSDTLLKQAVESCNTFKDKRSIVLLLQQVENGISRYLATITVINVGLGCATAATMWAIGIRNPILWGVLAATLNYVPHVGAFVCMAVLFVVGAVTHESLGFGAFAAGLFAILTAIETYLITPLILSRSLQLSPLAVILAILFWGWLWGIAGGLMAAPLLAVIKIVCDHFESLRGLGMFLSGTSGDLAKA